MTTDLLNEPLLTQKEVAALLQISPRTLERWVQVREIPFYRIGRSVRFRRDDISAHLVECHRPSVN